MRANEYEIERNRESDREGDKKPNAEKGFGEYGCEWQELIIRHTFAWGAHIYTLQRMHTQTDRQTQRRMHAGGTLHSPWQNDSLKDQCGCYLFLGHCVCVHVCVFNISRASYSVLQSEYLFSRPNGQARSINKWSGDKQHTEAKRGKLQIRRRRKISNQCVLNMTTS